MPMPKEIYNHQWLRPLYIPAYAVRRISPTTGLIETVGYVTRDESLPVRSESGDAPRLLGVSGTCWVAMVEIYRPEARAERLDQIKRNIPAREKILANRMRKYMRLKHQQLLEWERAALGTFPIVQSGDWQLIEIQPTQGESHV